MDSPSAPTSDEPNGTQKSTPHNSSGSIEESRLRALDEAALAVILSSVSDGVIVISASQQRILYANDALALMAGAESPEQLIGKLSESLLDEITIVDEQGTSIKRSLLPSFQALRGKIAAPTMLHIRNRAGHERWIISTAYPVPLTDNPRFAVAIWRDVTSQRTAQQALAIRDDFLSMASHELKTPVTSIKAFLQAVEHRMRNPDAFDFPKNLEYMGLLVKQVDRLTAIINDLLDINRMNRGKLTYSFTVLPIGPIIAEVVERMSASFPHHRLVLKLQNLTAMASIDELRFEQALTNIITNAVKYSPEDSTTDVVVAAAGDRITIEIIDRGIGISEEEQGHIFDPYYRTNYAIQANVPGMGVGLFISEQIIRAHDGTLRVHSTPGKGSTFVIELPSVEVA